MIMDKNLEDLLILFITQHKENLYRLAYSYVKNRDDALDIVQDSIQKAFVSLERLKNTESMKSWIYRIIVNTALDYLRKQKKIQVVDVESLDVYRLANDDVYQNIDLETALDNLPVMYRTVIVLRYFEDLKIEEIAEVLQENLNTVKTRLYKALQLLRIDMNDKSQEEEL